MFLLKLTGLKSRRVDNKGTNPSAVIAPGQEIDGKTYSGLIPDNHTVSILATTFVNILGSETKDNQKYRVSLITELQESPT